MNLALIIYFIGIADNINNIATIVILIGGTATLIMVSTWVTDEDIKETVGPYIKKGLIITGIAASINIIVPDTKTAYTILAAYGGQKIIESNTVNRIAPRNIDVIEKFLDEKLNEKAED